MASRLGGVPTSSFPTLGSPTVLLLFVVPSPGPRSFVTLRCPTYLISPNARFRGVEPAIQSRKVLFRLVTHFFSSPHLHTCTLSHTCGEVHLGHTYTTTKTCTCLGILRRLICSCGVQSDWCLRNGLGQDYTFRRRFSTVFGLSPSVRPVVNRIDPFLLSIHYSTLPRFFLQMGNSSGCRTTPPVNHSFFILGNTYSTLT